MRSSKRFHKVHIEISNICNLKCSFCPEVVRTKKRISLSDFKRIVQQVAPLADQVAFHLMGDPLVHPELSQFTEICHQHALPVYLVTNGVLLSEQRVEILLHPGIRQVCFSLHSFHDNFPDRDPKDYLERIFAFTERALVEQPDLYINYRLWNLQNPRGQTDSNVEILGRVQYRFGSSAPLTVDVFQQKSFRLKGRLYLHFDTEFTWPDLSLPPIGTRGTCYGLKSQFGILVDGTVVPCCLDKEGSIPLGNIFSRELLDILNDERAVAILKGFQRRHLVEDLCQRCQYIDRFKRPQDLRDDKSAPHIWGQK